MRRTREEDLNRWSDESDRKPVVLRGARQVGKSFLVDTWGARRFGRVVTANFEREPWPTTPCYPCRSISWSNCLGC